MKIFKSFKPQGEIICFSEVINICNKGKGAAIHVLFTGLISNREPLFEVKSVFFYLGAGGFGGDRGPKTEILEIPVDKKPNFSKNYQTQKNQAALYRLNGDRNPLHIDPEAAKRGGQKMPILHGFSTYGITTRAIVHNICGSDVSRFKEFRVRFANVVYPREPLIIEGWKINGKYIIQVRTERTVVLNNAYAIINDN
ncbi:MAG: MaoC family dehydratase [Candidatus Lokiarchaeota archaeon]|nr:MaoC family dehydratase [Candidatus Lokiarchaeota archaeon]